MMCEGGAKIDRRGRLADATFLIDDRDALHMVLPVGMFAQWCQWCEVNPVVGGNCGQLLAKLGPCVSVSFAQPIMHARA
jgi:hypothetical protein